LNKDRLSRLERQTSLTLNS